jgi:hypothetical protein
LGTDQTISDKAVEAAARALAADDELLEVARLAIEDALIEWRDERRSMPFRNNGLVVKERDGSPSDVIRFGPEMAMRIGLLAVAARVARGGSR